MYITSVIERSLPRDYRPAETAVPPSQNEYASRGAQHPRRQLRRAGATSAPAAASPAARWAGPSEAAKAPICSQKGRCPCRPRRRAAACPPGAGYTDLAEQGEEEGQKKLVIGRSAIMASTSEPCIHTSTLKRKLPKLRYRREHREARGHENEMRTRQPRCREQAARDAALFAFAFAAAAALQQLKHHRRALGVDRLVLSRPAAAPEKY